METVVKLWQSVDWDTVQARVESEVVSIGEREEAAEHGRKELLEHSNTYRQNTDKEQRRVAVPLIKAFQREVDNLTNRNKVTEAALIDLCRRLTSLPDPAPYLERAASWKQGAEVVDKREKQIAELENNIADLQNELSELQNQDVTIRHLRERIKQLEAEKTVEVEQSANDAEKLVREEFSLREQEMSVKIEKMAQENGVLEKKVSELEARMKESQRRADSARVDRERREAADAERAEMLSSDLRNAQQRIATFEVEIAHLASELAEARAAAPRQGLEDIAALGSLLKDRDDQIMRITEENRRLQQRLDSDVKKYRDKIDEQSKEIERCTRLVESLNAEIAKRSDYDQMKQELLLLRQMEFGCDSPSTGGPSEVASSLEGTLKTLDQLLVDKNKKLQADNAHLRTQYQQMIATSQLYENELATLRVENLSQKSLVEKLEADLAKACRPIAVVPALQADSTDLSTFEMLAESVREVGEADVASEQVKGRDADMSSYASIVAAQRDRLKQRVAILEQERVDEKRKTAILQDELERVKEDNGKLIGKIKFLQSYGSKKGDVAIQLDSEGKYAEQYERRIDPFRKFNQQESSRRMHEMRIHDRATYNIGRAIMTSGSARLTFFSYLLLLHLLVFLVLYRFAYTESCERDFETGCVERFRSHMLEHHPDGAHGHAD